MLPALARAYQAASAVRAPNLDWAVDRADALRSLGLRLLPRGGASLWVGREKRAGVLGALMLASALVVSITFPVALIAIGPIIYGVPHILADVRYLLARPGLSRRPLFLAALVIGCIIGAAGLGLRGALVGCALALAASRATPLRKAAGIGATAALFCLCQWAGGYPSDLAFVHLHNFVGVAIWFFWRERAAKVHWLFTALFFGASAAILLGATAPIVAATAGFSAPWTDLTFAEIARQLSPTAKGPWAERLTMLYAFAQAAHYVVWLRLMPEDDRPSPAPRSYRQTYRALVADVGGVVMWIMVLTALVFVVWACFSIGGARNAYMNVAFFHAHLELVAIAVLWTERRWPFQGKGERPASSTTA